jgi:hypothetical protein
MSIHTATYSETIYHAVDVLRILPFAFIGLVMVSGWRDTPKKKNTTTRRAKRGRRPVSVKAIDLVKDRKRKAKAAIPRPLSDFEDRLLADYFVKRNFVRV